MALATPTNNTEWLDLFVVAFPEYADAPQSLMLSKLDLAKDRTPADIWGTLYVQGVLYLWAHLLAQSPQSEAMKLDGGTSTIYKQERDRMAQSVASGYRVAGGIGHL